MSLKGNLISYPLANLIVSIFFSLAGFYLWILLFLEGFIYGVRCTHSSDARLRAMHKTILEFYVFPADFGLNSAGNHFPVDIAKDLGFHVIPSWVIHL